MQRVFARDVLECPACGGRMQVIAAIDQPEVIQSILRSLGLASRGPPEAPARPAEPELFSDPELEEPDPGPELDTADPPLVPGD